MQSDLVVSPLSSALSGRKIDVIISGSIAAVEAVRLVRSLRRLGADVYCHLTHGGGQFITPMALEWASTNPVRTGFEGLASHLASRDGCVVAPASASFLAKLAQGLTDTAAVALASSYLGSDKPLMLQACMHDSLRDSPVTAVHIESLSKHAVMLENRLEEGKHKFFEPDVLADEIAHQLNRDKKPGRCLITLGATRAFIDDVRCVTNTSTGLMGSLIAEECYRYGMDTHVICGYAQRLPKRYSRITMADTNDEMIKACANAYEQGYRAGVFCAAAVDYQCDSSYEGKIRSNQDGLELRLVPAPKIIAATADKLTSVVAFKLEPDLDADKIKLIAERYFSRYRLTALLLNTVQKGAASKHQGWLVTGNSGEPKFPAIELSGKSQIAAEICKLLRARFEE